MVPCELKRMAPKLMVILPELVMSAAGLPTLVRVPPLIDMIPKLLRVIMLPILPVLVMLPPTLLVRILLLLIDPELMMTVAPKVLVNMPPLKIPLAEFDIMPLLVRVPPALLLKLLPDIL
jgi:hypothetical protein